MSAIMCGVQSKVVLLSSAPPSLPSWPLNEGSQAESRTEGGDIVWTLTCFTISIVVQCIVSLLSKTWCNTKRFRYEKNTPISPPLDLISHCFTVCLIIRSLSLPAPISCTADRGSVSLPHGYRIWVFSWRGTTSSRGMGQWVCGVRVQYVCWLRTSRLPVVQIAWKDCVWCWRSRCPVLWNQCSHRREHYLNLSTPYVSCTWLYLDNQTTTSCHFVLFLPPFPSPPPPSPSSLFFSFCSDPQYFTASWRSKIIPDVSGSWRLKVDM